MSIPIISIATYEIKVLVWRLILNELKNEQVLDEGRERDYFPTDKQIITLVDSALFQYPKEDILKNYPVWEELSHYQLSQCVVESLRDLGNWYIIEHISTLLNIHPYLLKDYRVLYNQCVGLLYLTQSDVVSDDSRNQGLIGFTAPTTWTYAYV